MENRHSDCYSVTAGTLAGFLRWQWKRIHSEPIAVLLPDRRCAERWFLLRLCAINHCKGWNLPSLLLLDGIVDTDMGFDSVHYLERRRDMVDTADHGAAQLR